MRIVRRVINLIICSWHIKSVYSVVGIVACSFLFTTCKNSTTLFEQIQESHSGINFRNNLPDRKGFNILYYLYFYEGGGVATGDINNDGLTDIYFTANTPGNNKLYLNKGNMEFEDITIKGGVAGVSDWCSGVTMADVNADGWLDIYVCAVSEKFGLKGHNQLFINNKNGSFTDMSAQYGLDLKCYSAQAAFFDYDHDGDIDCYVLNESDRPNQNIVDTSNRRKYDAHSGDRLLRNDLNTASKKFTDVSAAAGIFQSSLGYGLGLAVADVNNDGWDDIYVGNDFHENDYYYVNNGNGTFTESGEKHFKHYSRFSMGNDIADFNNDGQPDVVTVDMLPQDEKILKTYGSDDNTDIYNFKIIKNGFQHQYSKNCLQQNNGSGISFSDVGLQAGVAATDWSWCPLFADFDNDGYKDLFITSGIVKRTTDMDYVRFVSNAYMQKQLSNSTGLDDEAISKMPDGISHSYIFKGNGKSFSDESEAWGFRDKLGYFNGAAYADLDNDGDLDLVVNAINAPAQLYKNNSTRKSTVTISFKGTDANRFGIGTKVYAFAGGKMQYQQLMLTRGFESSTEPRLHFGFGDLTVIDSILIVWPDQRYQLVKNTVINKPLVAEQQNAAGHFDYKNFFPSKAPAFRDVSAEINCSWKHAENNFNDFNNQFLIPHKQSARGPKIAVADVNKDGLDDFFVCGANGQPGAMMIQDAKGKFAAADTAVFSKYSNSEEVDALFFDANKDGFEDLYVVSGGNEYADGNPALADKLYLGKGNGHFSLATGYLPLILTNKSCVAAADVDNDGDTDLFVGGLADAKKFGLPQASFLLMNDGTGHFKTAPAPVINLNATGIVTSAVFADLNRDGWKDIVIAGEWMPLKIFLNTKGTFRATEVPGSTGLWQTLYSVDVNGDGFDDLLAGNWGYNSKLYAGKNGPLKLFIKDFDKNGSIEQIMTYNIAGKDYTFLAKDELERALPVLKKAYLTYGEVAGKTVDYMFYDLFNNYTELKAEVLGSSCFINDSKGNFSRVDLPGGLQQAPVFSFTPVGGKSFIAAGNFYGVTPYEGRYDALYPTVFSFESGKKEFKTNGIFPFISDEVRDMKWLNYAGGQKLLLVAINNKPLVFLKPADLFE